MKSKKPSFLSALRRSDKILLGIVTALFVATIILNVMQRCGLSLINAPVILFLPIAALLLLIAWGGWALIRRIQSRVARIAAGVIGALALLLVVTLGVTYLSFVAYTALPHAYKTVTDPEGGHPLVVMWQFDSDAERNETSVAERTAARLEAYPDSSPDTTPDDVTVAFSAYPKALGLFYRSKADVEGKVFLAYTGNIAAKDVIQPEEGSDAEPQVVETPHGTMMLEWLEDNAVAHFYVKDPGTAEGGECTVRFE